MKAFHAEEKKRLRQKILKRRSQLSSSEIQAASAKILNFLCESEIYQKSSIIHSFLPLGKEPDTLPIIKNCWKNHKTVVIPCVESGTYKLKHSLLTSFEFLVQGKYKISTLPPEYQETVPADYADLCLIPVVGVGAHGERLGYGKGYYDRFLSESSGFRLALALDIQKEEKLPAQSHDIPMNAVLSESGFQFF